MPDDNAGESGTKPEAGQKPDEVSTQEKSVQEKDPNVSEDAKTQEKEPEDPKDEKPKENKDVKKDEQLPFHKHPAWQRMLRKNEKANGLVRRQGEMLTELINTVKEIAAGQKGEEYKPKKTDDFEWDKLDFDDVLDSEMEQLVTSLGKEDVDLSPGDEEEIVEIAKKYSKEVEGKKVYLSAPLAYQIWKDLQESKPEDKKKTSTKPSAGGSEKDVGKVQITKPGEKRKSLDQIVAEAKRLAEVYVD